MIHQAYSTISSSSINGSCRSSGEASQRARQQLHAATGQVACLPQLPHQQGCQRQQQQHAQAY
jgi:hypothetical protein